MSDDDEDDLVNEFAAGTAKWRAGDIKTGRKRVSDDELTNAIRETQGVSEDQVINVIIALALEFPDANTNEELLAAVRSGWCFDPHATYTKSADGRFVKLMN